MATVEEAESALSAHPKAKAIFMTHSETSTGALFPVHEIARAAKARGADDHRRRHVVRGL